MQRSIYEKQTVLLITKHKKAIAIAPVFRELLGTQIEELELDTDTLGTFTGEVQRIGNAYECARKKCLWGLEHNNTYFGIASEGSFGPHPSIPGAFSDLEILYFRDRKNDFELTITHLSSKSNFGAQSISDVDQLLKFASSVSFPSHALIVRPNQPAKTPMIFKGISCQSDLLEAYEESRQHSVDHQVCVETDMRAHMNPTRMAVIREAAELMAHRLASPCPTCQTPGWGMTAVERGLRCEVCGLPTEMIQYRIFGCTKCAYKRIIRVMTPYHSPTLANALFATRDESSFTSQLMLQYFHIAFPENNSAF